MHNTILFAYKCIGMIIKIIINDLYYKTVKTYNIFIPETNRIN